MIHMKGNLKKKKNQGPGSGVAHACNPSYSGGRDQASQFEASPGK
jgi:hypothetical protein